MTAPPRAAAPADRITRREFVSRIAFAYASFEAETLARYPGAKITPLDRRFARSTGAIYVERGEYRAQTDRASIDPMWMDWDRVAREARDRVPYWRRQIAEFGVD